MNEQTKKLSEKIASEILYKMVTVDHARMDIAPLCYEYADQILKAFKEAGLIFVEFPEQGEDLTGTCLCRVKEIDV